MSLDMIIDDVLNAPKVPFGAGKEPGAQRTPDWLRDRIGHCTASMFHAVLDYTKAGKEGAKRRNYRVRLIVERLLNEATDNYVTWQMQWGVDNEDQARMAYEARTGAFVEQVGFLRHASLGWCGASPDGLIDEDGCIEAKCPAEPGVHVQTILNGMPEEHMAQCQGVMWVANRKYCDFISYDPRMPENLRIYVQRIERDDEYIVNLDIEVRRFLAEVKDTLATLQERVL